MVPSASHPPPPHLPPPHLHLQNHPPPPPPLHHNPGPPQEYHSYHPNDQAYQARHQTLPDIHHHPRGLPPPPQQHHYPHYQHDTHAPRRSPPPHTKHESGDGGYQQPPPTHNPEYASTSVKYTRPSDTPSAPIQAPPGSADGPYNRFPPPPSQESHESYRRASMDHGPPYSGVPTLAQHLQHSGLPPSAAPTPMPPPPIDTGSLQAYTPPSQYPPPSPWDSQYQYSYDTQLGPNGQPRRKAVRASQACDNCRAKKAKCDEGRPTCGNCEQNALECNYRHVPPPKQDRTVLQLTDQVMHLTTRFDQFVAKHDRQEAIRQGDYQELKRLILGMSSPGPGSTFGIKQPDSPSATPSNYAVHSGHRASFGYGQIGESQSDAIQRVMSHDSKPANAVESSVLDQAKQRGKYAEIRKEAHLDMLNGELAIPACHTTAAHELREWPGITSFFDDLNVPQKYVKDAEHNHHLDLSLYTLGPLLGEQGQRPSISSPAAADVDDASSMSGSSDGRPAAAFVNLHCVEGSRGSKPSPGGRNQNQSLSIDRHTAWLLFHSYLQNIHILQPFVNKVEASRLVNDFIDAYCSEPKTNSYASNARPDSTGPNGFKKRKHTHGSTPEYSETGQRKLCATKKPIHRTVDNALILLIFALGKICEHKAPLPAPRSIKSKDGIVPIEDSMSPIQSTPKFGTATPSTDGRSPLGANDYSKFEDRRWSQNIDRIPGAAYFAHAVSILGENLGGNSLTHVQAHLLAGLYLGQLVHVYDSWKWINAACVAWLMLFKYYDDNPEVLSDGERLTYWACLICESDILAELELIPSGLSKFEDKINFPQAMALDEDDEELRTYYLAQISIRKLLNRAHSALYNQSKKKTEKSQHGWTALNSIQLQDQLEQWRSHLPVQLRWDDFDEAADTINGARLRGKYYGARNIIFRPFLYRAVSGRGAQEAEGDSRSEEEQFKSDTQIMENAINCIRACVYSTMAFDNVPGMKKRLIVTNIFGTAHAQFGNMLVLGAACKAGPTGPSFQPRELLGLLKRTIEFLGYLAPLSPTMAQNVKILEGMEQYFRAEISLPNSAHQSFHS